MDKIQGYILAAVIIFFVVSGRLEGVLRVLTGKFTAVNPVNPGADDKDKSGPPSDLLPPYA